MRKISLENTNPAGKKTIKEINQKLILNLIREHQPISRAEIAGKTGLQRSTVTIITSRLLEENWIYEGENGSAGIGRKPTNLYLNSEKFSSLGVQIGRQETLLALADVNGKIQSRHSLETLAEAPKFFARLAREIKRLISDSQRSRTSVAGIGVSLPGYIEKATGNIIAAENFGWMNVPAGDWLRKNLSIPLYFENNAKLSAFAEIWFGDHRDHSLRNVICVTSRDGIGTGIIINGEIYNGARDGAAEFGHVSLFPYGERCSCGNYGCWEIYASDMATIKRYTQARNGSRSGSGREEVTIYQVIQRARQGEKRARMALQSTAKYLGLGIANLVYGFNPEMVIVGDTLKDAWEIIGDIVLETVRGRVPGYYIEGLKIVPSSRKDSSSLLGAIALVLAHNFTISRGV